VKAQNVNLYPHEFREAPTVLPTVAMVRIAGLFLVVLAILTGGAALMEWSQRRAAAFLAGGLAERRARIDALNVEVAKHLDASGLELRLGTARAELERKRSLVTLLEQGVGRSSHGFSSALVGLGRQRVEGLWLTDFALVDGEELALRGRAFSGALLLRYLDRLGGEAAFDGSEFRTFALERDVETPSVLRFDVRTERAEAKP
jgi:hypothetical protein